MSQLKPRHCNMRGNSPGKRIALTEKLRLTALSTSSSRKSSSLQTTRQRNLSGISEAYTFLATQTSPSQRSERYRTLLAKSWGIHVLRMANQVPFVSNPTDKLCAGYVRLAKGASRTAMLDSSLRLPEQ